METRLFHIGYENAKQELLLNKRSSISDQQNKIVCFEIGKQKILRGRIIHLKK